MSKNKELVKRLMACKHWRVMRGMVDEDGCVVVDADEDSWIPADCDSVMAWADFSDFVPDLTDPATLGCLLVLVREAWRPVEAPTHGEAGAADIWASICVESTVLFSGGVAWHIGLGVSTSDEFRESVHGHYDSEAEALIQALEAAP